MVLLVALLVALMDDCSSSVSSIGVVSSIFSSMVVVSSIISCTGYRW